MNKNFKNAVFKIVSKTVYVLFPMTMGFYFGMSRNILFIIIGLIPLMLDLTMEENKPSIRITRFVEEKKHAEKKNRRKTKRIG